MSSTAALDRVELGLARALAGQPQQRAVERAIGLVDVGSPSRPSTTSLRSDSASIM